MSSKLIYLFMRGVFRFVSILKNNVLSFVTLVTILFMYNVFWVAGNGTSSFLNHLSNTSAVRAYLASDNAIVAEEIMSVIKSMDNVSSCRFYSSKDAKEFALKYAPKSVGLENISEELFPSFIEIIPADSSEEILNKISENVYFIEGVEDVSYGKEYMAKFKSVGRGAWLFIVSMTILFGLAVIFVVYNTVKLSLYKFKDEIKLYSLVGATRPFISVPYFFASLLLSFFSFMVSFLLFTAIFIPFNNNVLSSAGINIFTLPSTLYFVILYSAVGIISVISAHASVVSFLKQVSSINED